jgi:hypothetical protein
MLCRRAVRELLLASLVLVRRGCASSLSLFISFFYGGFPNGGFAIQQPMI